MRFPLCDIFTSYPHYPHETLSASCRQQLLRNRARRTRARPLTSGGPGLAYTEIGRRKSTGHIRSNRSPIMKLERLICLASGRSSAAACCESLSRSSADNRISRRESFFIDVFILKLYGDNRTSTNSFRYGIYRTDFLMRRAIDCEDVRNRRSGGFVWYATGAGSYSGRQSKIRSPSSAGQRQAMGR
jgi:hypothetical protein